MLRTAHAAKPLDPAHPGHAPPRRPPPPVTLVALLAAAGLACGGDTPIEVERDEMCPAATVPLCSPSNAAAAVAARDATSDAAGRSTPALDNATARTALASNLSQLDNTIAAGNVTKALDALRGAREALAAARGQLTSFPGDAADLAAIELALDRVAPLLGTS